MNKNKGHSYQQFLNLFILFSSLILISSCGGGGGDDSADTRAPDTLITSSPAVLTNSIQARFEFNSTESGSTFECSLDNADFLACSSPLEFDNLVEGSHNFEVRAKDSAGNADSTHARHQWVIDTIAPDTEISSAPAILTNSTNANFEFTSTEDGSSFQCSLDGSAFIDCTSPQLYTGLVESNHDFSVRAIDTAGNIDPTPDSHDWTIDISAPQTSINSGPSNPTNLQTASFTFSSDDTEAVFSCSVDGVPMASCSSPINYTVLTEGSHQFNVQATDAAGNTDATAASYQWIIDLTPPDTTINSGPDDSTNSTEASFTFSSNETGSSFECALDGSSFSGCTSPENYTGLTEGVHSFNVRATDIAGNTNLSSTSYDWVIDLTAPETTITSNPDSLTNSGDATFTFISDEDGVTFICSLDSSSFTSCTSPKTYTGLTHGIHSFAVKAIDAAGNTDLSADSYSWVIDLIPPVTTITSSPDDPTNMTEATFIFTSNEPASTFECSVDGAAFANCVNPVNYSGLAEGIHEFSVKATDEVGNTDLTTDDYSWEIDLTPPETTIISAPDDPSNLTEVEFSFTSSETSSTFECSLDGSALTACTSPQSYTGLTETTHNFKVQATDQAGNTDQTASNFDWEIDTTPPDTTIDSGPDDLTNLTEAVFTFSSTESGSTFECSMDGTDYENCESPFNYPGLTEGSHSFAVRSTDMAGNTDQTADSLAWDIDITPPETTIIACPDNPTNSTIANFEFESSETGSTFECSLDSATLTSCISPTGYSGLSAGHHSFSVQAIDEANNSDPTVASCEWFIGDGSLPPTMSSIIINKGVDYAINITEFSARLIATDDFAVTDYLITEHNATDPLNVIPPYLDPLISDSSWVSVTETSMLDITIQYPLTQSHNVGDTVELCAWVMDAEGNISDRMCDSITYGVSWESGWDNWYASNGTWEVGVPTSGPNSCYSGTQCAATVLDGNYPTNSSNLVSPSITLPTLALGEEIQLRFWHWFSFSSYDSGNIYVQEETEPGVWTTSDALKGFSGVSGGVWTRPLVDLSAYAGKKVRILFQNKDGGVSSSYVSSGWYIDDVTIDVITADNSLPYSDDFEGGLLDWWASNGTWEVGTPTTGPNSCYSGTQCAATVLDGNYPTNSSNLISPSITLPTLAPGEEIQLRFWHWFSFSGYDSGNILIQEETSPGVWTTSDALKGFSGVSGGVWTRPLVDLSAYAGKKVRILFQNKDGGVSSSYVSSGWYIDDVTIDVITADNSLPYSDDFEGGLLDWWASNGTWEVGTPTTGPNSCYSGTQCAATVLDGNYPTNSSNLISPSITLPSLALGEEIQLRFWHWFSFSSYDSGNIYVQEETEPGVWTTSPILKTYIGTSGGVWTRPLVDLTAYAGKKVRILFQNKDGGVNSGYVSTGWYIDDVTIEVF